jgi:hypothetical protein
MLFLRIVAVKGNLLIMIMYRHTSMGFWVLTAEGYELAANEALCNLRDRYLNSEGRCLARFEGTCCFLMVGSRLQDNTGLHLGNSTPNLRIYIVQQQNVVH